MKMIVIAVICNPNKTIKGYRIMDKDTGEIIDVTSAQVLNVLKNKTVIEGLKLEAGKIKGSNGSLDRYTKLTDRGALVDGNIAFVILNSIDDVGYRFARYDGLTKNAQKQHLLEGLAKNPNLSIANGKVVIGMNGKYISSISGSYDNISLEEFKKSLAKQISDNIKVAEEVNKKIEKTGEGKLIKKTYTVDKGISGVESGLDILKRFDEKSGMDVEQKIVYMEYVIKRTRPFYYYMLTSLNKKFTLEVDTMAVSIDTFYINPKYVYKVTLPELVFSGLHEIMHVAMMHTYRGIGKERECWGLAIDYFVNEHLIEEFKLPRNGNPVKIKMKVNENGKDKMVSIGGDDMNRFSISLPQFVCVNPNVDLSKDTAESLYKELYDLKQLNKNMQSQQGLSQQGNKGQEGQSGQIQQQQDGQNEQNGNGQQQQGNQQGQGHQNQQGSQEQSEQGQQQQGQCQQNEQGQQGSQEQSEQGQEQSEQGQQQQGQCQQNGQSGGQGQQQVGQGGPAGGNWQATQSNNQNQGESNDNENSGLFDTDYLDDINNENKSGQGNNSSNTQGNSGKQNDKTDGTSKGSGPTFDGKDKRLNNSDKVKGTTSGDVKGNDSNNSEKMEGMNNGQTVDGADSRKGERELEGKTFRGVEISGNYGDDIIRDSHTPTTKEQAKQMSQAVLARAVTMAKKHIKNWSPNEGGLVERLVVDALAPKVNWRSLLKSQLTLASQKVNTFAAPDKRFRSRGMIMPGPKKLENDTLENVKICVDTSGSISNEDIGVALAQIEQLLKVYKAKAELLYWDTSVRVVYPFEKIDELVSKKPLGGGGTDANCIFDYFETNRDYRIGKKKKPEIVIVFTDGYFGELDSSYKKYRNTIWIINNGVKDFKPPFGKVAPFKIED